MDGTVGLLHKKNVSEGFVKSLPDLFEEAQLIKVMIVTLEDDKGRISLSTKVLENYKGEILENMEQVMADAKGRVRTARKKLPKP